MLIITTLPVTKTELSVSENLDYVKHLARKSVEQGVNIFRFNLSSVSLFENWQNFVDLVKVVRNLDARIRIICDLPYPKVSPRLYCNQDVLMVKKGDNLIFGNENYKKTGTNGYINVPDFTDYFSLGCHYFCSDGIGKLKVTKLSKDVVQFHSENDFELITSKPVTGNSMITTNLDASFLKMLNTVKPDILFFSFVENVDFLAEFKNSLNFHPEFMMKIETEAGIANLESICKESDGIIVARGDLAVNSGAEYLYKNQNLIINTASKFKKPVWVATDVLSSLYYRKFPSRGDIIDVSVCCSDIRISGLVLNVPVLISDNFSDAICIIKKCEKIYTTA